MGDQRHTPLGVVALTKEWADKELPARRERLTKIRETAARVEANVLGELAADLTRPATSFTKSRC